MKKIWIVFCVVVFACNLLTAENAAKNLTPPKIKAFEFSDLETLVYGVYINGVKNYDCYLVFEHDPANPQQVNIYLDLVDYTRGKPTLLPKDYKDFYELVILDTTTGLVKSAYQNTIAKFKSRGLKGLTDIAMEYNTQNGELVTTQKLWDGFETRQSVYRMKIAPSIPIVAFDMPFFVTRVFDFNQSATLALVYPTLLADPMYAILKPEKQENLQAAGRAFVTTKVKAELVDKFVNKLAGPIVKGYVFWVDNSVSQYVVKWTAPTPQGEEKCVLEKITSWGELP